MSKKTRRRARSIRKKSHHKHRGHKKENLAETLNSSFFNPSLFKKTMPGCDQNKAIFKPKTLCQPVELFPHPRRFFPHGPCLSKPLPDI
jgi:hypothetical protein